jgi:hypothetical protein
MCTSLLKRTPSPGVLAPVKEAIPMTDEFSSYSGLADEYAAHEVVKHSAGEYSRPSKHGGKAGTNSAESFFALLKRGHYG